MNYRVSASFQVNAEVEIGAATPEAALAQARDLWNNADPVWGRWAFDIGEINEDAPWPDDAEAWPIPLPRTYTPTSMLPL